MKKTITLILSLVLHWHTAYAQTASDDIVIATPPFSLQDEVIKKGTRGVNFGQIVASIIKAKPPVKSEYETKDEFDARRVKWEEKKIYGNIGVGSRVAVIVPAVTLPFAIFSEALSTEYDAETEIMKASMQSGLKCNGVMLSEATKPKREYVASNRFGAKVKVLVVEEKRECIEFGEGGKLKSAKQEFSFKTQRKSAEDIKYLLHVAIIGRISAPYAQVENSREAPTMRFPVEKDVVTRTLVLDVDSIWLVNPFSGAVLAKSAMN